MRIFALSTTMLVTFLSLLAPPALAEGTSVPVAVPAPERVVLGFDWEARTHAAHILLDSRPFILNVSLNDIRREYVDLELSPMMAGRVYKMEGVEETRYTRGSPSGTAILWNVPAEPSTWALLDGISGEVVNLIVLTPREGEDPFAPQPLAGAYCPGCYYNPWRVRRPPPVSEEVSNAYVVEQAAYSFTAEVPIHVKNCWKHHVSVDGSISGGEAASGPSAGGTHTYENGWCNEIHSQGTGVEFRVQNVFHKDMYRDGSYSVYSLGPTDSFGLFNIDSFTPPDEAGLVTMQSQTGSLGMTFTERGAGGVRYGVGARAFGVGLGVTYSSTDDSTAEVQVVFPAPPEGTDYYRFWIVNGDRSRTGIVAAAWKVHE